MRIVVVGAGGHAKVVVDAARCAGHDVVAILDDRTDIETVLGVPITVRIADVRADGFVVALGDNGARSRAFAEHIRSVTPVTVVHPDAVVAKSARIGVGSVILAGVVVNAEAVIGDDVILNTRCSIDHDCRIDAHAHIAPGVTICGGTHVAEGALVGAGSSVIPRIRIGQWSVVGAGASVVADVPDGETHAGTPARPLLKCPGRPDGPS